jgi:hypothetical protein
MRPVPRLERSQLRTELGGCTQRRVDRYIKVGRTWRSIIWYSARAGDTQGKRENLGKRALSSAVWNQRGNPSPVICRAALMDRSVGRGYVTLEPPGDSVGHVAVSLREHMGVCLREPVDFIPPLKPIKHVLQ